MKINSSKYTKREKYTFSRFLLNESFDYTAAVKSNNKNVTKIINQITQIDNTQDKPYKDNGLPINNICDNTIDNKDTIPIR